MQNNNVSAPLMFIQTVGETPVISSNQAYFDSRDKTFKVKKKIETIQKVEDSTQQNDVDKTIIDKANKIFNATKSGMKIVSEVILRDDFIRYGNVTSIQEDKIFVDGLPILFSQIKEINIQSVKSI